MRDARQQSSPARYTGRLDRPPRVGLSIVNTKENTKVQRVQVSILRAIEQAEIERNGVLKERVKQEEKLNKLNALLADLKAALKKAEDERAEAPSDSASPTPDQPAPDTEPSPRALQGLRQGSKNYRVYKAAERLLQGNGTMHVDQLLESIQASEPSLFGSVKDARMNLGNLLSLLKSRGLLVSDHRGNWSLPK
jgi:hypothetical protein